MMVDMPRSRPAGACHAGSALSISRISCLLAAASLLSPMLATANDAALHHSELLPQRDAIATELRQPGTASAEARATPDTAVAIADGQRVAVETIIVTGRRQDAKPIAQTATRIDLAQFANQPGTSIAEALALSPGVSFVQGNGPRDVAVSVRGSSNRQTYGVRNIKVFEDGFDVTQPDGLSRTDLTDAHAYGDIDVVRGPSSAWYGNYASGGAIDFRLRDGGEIRGLETGLDAGSFGYLNAYALAGDRGQTYNYTAFFSNVRGRSHIGRESCRDRGCKYV